ncbi:MAG: NACHT domain-containing protein, partial [Herpetosiphonaceae bacterium]|nr:NACHT domain-containing protein [Herpetosiphonaceae bacterium]
LIVGLALNYSPNTLNFVLVDYKGGGAFKPFERLPHCVDIVTNLNRAAVDRMFTAIKAEIDRRQKLNADSATKDIVEYRRKGLHKTLEPYPYLFIIIDEYSEMISENDEYRNQLDSITRVGRAQGINLILASQQPKGVSDQMRANIKLRLCLRVEQMDTSRELLRRPDAALLPNGIPGRGYLQVGNENLELVQMSYTGENQPDTREMAVRWPDRPPVESKSADADVPKLYDAVVTLTSELVQGHMAPKPWPGFLPESFTLESGLIDARHRPFVLEPIVTDWRNGDTKGLWTPTQWGGAFTAIVGLLDDPAQAAQYPLRFDLKRNHLAVFGDAGMGKTTFLRTLLVSLAANHSPGEFQAYLLDLGGRNFRTFESLPHVGAVIYADEETFEERMGRLLETVERMIEERQRILSNAGVSSLYEFNTRFPDQARPAILVAIDGMAELQENYPTVVETTLLSLVRRSLAVGITFVVSGNVPTSMPGKLFNLFGERITFKQSKLDTYMDIVGRGAIEIGETPGRGYIRKDRRPLLFHIAQPVGIFTADGSALYPEDAELRRLISQMRAYPQQAGVEFARPEPINALDQYVALAEVLGQAAPPRERRVESVLGRNSQLQPAMFDLKRMSPHFMIVGPPLAGKTTTLRNWALSLTTRYTPDQVMLVLVDLQRKFVDYRGQRSLADLPHVVMTVSEAEQLPELASLLKTESERLAAQTTPCELFVLIDDFDDFSAEVDRSQRDMNRDLATLARRYGRDGLHFIITHTLAGRDTSDLKRQIQAANLGIGLRTAEALQALGAMRTPPGLRDKELPVGRGYLVKSGQATLIQVASPYGIPDPLLVADGDAENEEELAAQALDQWVEQISARYPARAARRSASAVVTSPEQAGSPAQSARVAMMRSLLQRGMQRELARLKNGHGTEDGAGAATLITEQLIGIDMVGWSNEDLLGKLLKELWLKEQLASGLPKEVIDALAGVLDGDSLLLELDSLLST